MQFIPKGVLFLPYSCLHHRQNILRSKFFKYLPHILSLKPCFKAVQSEILCRGKGCEFQVQIHHHPRGAYGKIPMQTTLAFSRTAFWARSTERCDKMARSSIKSRTTLEKAQKMSPASPRAYRLRTGVTKRRNAFYARLSSLFSPASKPSRVSGNIGNSPAIAS